LLAPDGISTEVVGTGTVSGFNYIDLRWSGTRSGGAQTIISVLFETSTQVVASSGQTWTASAYLALTGGSYTNATSPAIRVIERAGGGAALAGTSTAFTATASLARTASSRTFSEATTARTSFQYQANVADGAAIDITLRIAAPQLERGAFATSYIPTTSAAATRAADSAVVTPISSFYNQAEGTLFAELEPRGTLISSRYFQIDDGTDANRITLGTTSGGTIQNFTQNGGVTVLSSSISGVSLISGSVFKVASAFSNNNTISSGNGTLGTLDTNGDMPSGLNRLGVNGQVGTAGNRAHWLRKIAYYPKHLSDTLLQQLTT
jgi:hypothetical protein